MKKFRRKTNLTQGYLQRAAYRYLERYETTEANLVFILKRKADRIISREERDDIKEKKDCIEIEHISQWIKEIVGNCIKHGLVNDKLYAEARIRVFFNAGNSLPIIRNKLRAKGVCVNIINDLITQTVIATPNVNFKSCIKYARRRRFGPYRNRPIKEDTAQKEQASMARAGFSYTETKRVLSATQTALDNILYEK